MRPAGSGGVPASAALPLLDNAPRHCRRRGAWHLPARRAERDLRYDSDRLLASGETANQAECFHPIEIRIA